MRMLNTKTRNHQITIIILLLATLTLAACNTPKFPDLPGLPSDLKEIPDVLKNLELPDLSGIGIDLPGADALPVLIAPAGGIVFSGPIERQVKIGERIPGTDITLLSTADGVATFQVAGMQKPSRAGDSVDYDGAFAGLPGSDYRARYRVYLVGNNDARIAGVHQLLLNNITPVKDASVNGAATLRFPFTDGVDRGTGNLGSDLISGTTLGYLGVYDRGAQIFGLPDNQYPFRSVADTIEWQGALRSDIGADYDLRVLNYGNESMRVGGTVVLTLPSE